jgi:hypothetical protein
MVKLNAVRTTPYSTDRNNKSIQDLELLGLSTYPKKANPNMINISVKYMTLTNTEYNSLYFILPVCL